MTETKMLVGSLSNDLLRIANSTYFGSTATALRFLTEAKRWSQPLKDKKIAKYIQQIALNVSATTTKKISLPQAERFLMYSTLLQNYSLRLK